MADKKLLWCLTFAIVVHVCATLLITELRVPSLANHEAPLDCKYKLGDTQLYDVKWYKDGDQFFRCLPNGEVNEYPVDGLKVYHARYAPLGSCPVTLMSLNAKSSGEYKCEVSAEAPHFNVATKSAKLRFVPFVVKKETKEIKRVHSTVAPEHKEKNSTWHALSSRGNPTISHRLSSKFNLLFIITVCAVAIL